jgi:putative DNA primase/helicase
MPPGPDVAAFPADLRRLRRWVTWRSVKRRGKTTKPPMQSIKEPNEWLCVSDACDVVAKGDAKGVGLVIPDGIVGIDLDDCIEDDGTLHPIARDLIELGTYVERSPSGRGLRAFIRGQIPKCHNIGPRSGVPRHEIYDGSAAHFLTVTGERVSVETELRVGPDAQAALDAYYAKWFADRREPEEEPGRLSDDTILRLLRSSKNSAKFDRLYRADWTGYASHSEADLALCRLIRFYTRDPAQIDRIFQGCALVRPKWLERHGERTYGEMTIAKAIAQGGPTYTPRDPKFEQDAAERRATHERKSWARIPLWWDARLKGAGELTFRVLHAIVSYADKDGVAYPAIETIAAHVGASERWVYDAIAKIKAAGIMTSKRRYRDSNLYRLALRVPETITPYAMRRKASRVMKPRSLGVTPVVPTNRPRTDQELDTGESDESPPESDEPNSGTAIIAFPEPCMPLKPSARRLRARCYADRLGGFFLAMTVRTGKISFLKRTASWRSDRDRDAVAAPHVVNHFRRFTAFGIIPNHHAAAVVVCARNCAALNPNRSYVE